MRYIALLTLLLASCTLPEPPTPTADAIETLKEACIESCETPQEVTVSIRAGSELYTTEDAICIRTASNRLYCGTCTCGSFGLAPGIKKIFSDDNAVTCTFSNTGGNITASC